MGFLDIFKKKNQEEQIHYDPTNIKIIDIRKGWLFDYEGKTWEVVEEFEYDWGDNIFTYEYKIQSGADTAYMFIEESEKVYCTFTNKIKFAKLGEEVEQHLLDYQKPPSQITYEGITFYRERESPGYFRSLEDEDSIEVILWEYFDDSETKILLIHQWDEGDFEASVGIVEEENVISNILPR
jgi:hypothetical protein